MKHTRKFHFICYANSPYDKANLQFLPYAAISKERTLYHDTSFDLTEFINRILEGKIGVSLENLQEYIKFLKNLAGSSSSSVGGLIVNIDKNGMPNLVRFDNLFILANEVSLNQANELGKDRGLDRDMGDDLER